MTYDELSIAKLKRRCLVTYAVVQFSFYCKLRMMGDTGEVSLTHLRDVGFDVVEREGKFHLTEKERKE